MNQFYPERTITVMSRDPDCLTPEIKSKLRRKNKLMRGNRVAEASAVAVQIGKDITRRNKTRLNKIKGKEDARVICTAVCFLTCQYHIRFTKQ